MAMILTPVHRVELLNGKMGFICTDCLNALQWRSRNGTLESISRETYTAKCLFCNRVGIGEIWALEGGR